jgi:hypothetical protein
MAAKAGKANSDGCCEQLERDLEFPLAIPETVLLVAFGNRHEHRAEHTGCPERRQEAERTQRSCPTAVWATVVMPGFYAITHTCA